MKFDLLYLIGFIRILIIILILFWIFSIIAVSIKGKERKIGFWIALLLSVLFTPILGLIAVLLSEKKNRFQ